MEVSGYNAIMREIEKHILEGTPSDVVTRYETLPEKAERLDFGILDSNVVVIDTETTGFSFNHDELIQIAAARIENGSVVDWYVTFVNPGFSIPDDIVHLTSIHDQDVIDAPSPSEALAGLVNFAGNATMVAHNVGFDKTFVTRHPEGYPLLENLWVDTLDLSRIALPRLKSHRLIDLVHTFGTPVSTHRADDDVAATCVVYRILLSAVYSMPLSLVEEIGSMATREEWSTSEVFRVIAALRCDESDDLQEGIPDVSRETVELELEGLPRQKRLFSLFQMRKKRIVSLPTVRARKDADDLVGELVYPSNEEVEGAFTTEGILGDIYDNYEPRDEQKSMASAITKAFSSSENLVVEAGTGVGKSMAYLVPAALFAQANNVAVGIATKTNSLLDQLVYKELPALSVALSNQDSKRERLRWAPLKGMTHYPCLRKISRIVENGPGFKEIAGQQISESPALAALLSFIEQSEFNDMDSLKIDYRTLPRYRITSKSSECLRRKCPFFGKLCFVHGARRRAESSDIIVTNHSLLFCDVAADGGLLPTTRHWIVDEAHSCESEARSAFAQTLDSEAIVRIANLVDDTSGARGIFARAERGIGALPGEQLTLFYGLVSKARSAGSEFSKAAHEYLSRVKDLLYFDPVKRNKRGHSYEQVDIWINDEVRRNNVFKDVAICVHEFIEKSDELIRRASDLVAYLEGIDEAAVAQREIASCVIELRDLRNAAEIIFEVAPETYAYQATLNRKKDRKNDKLQALLLEVGQMMNETLFTRTHSIVFTSATLSVGGSFQSFESSLGLNESEFSVARDLVLESSYDYDNNMIIYVVSDMPEPIDPGYSDALNHLLVETHKAQRGSMLTLFTNRKEMERSFEYVEPILKAENLRLVCQKYGVSVKGLRDDFLSDEHLSLFALKTFWEGFDAPGATLKGVIIPKLPFGRPTDPLYCERASRDDRAWWRYVLPQAVIETKQAAGRLIRKSDDHGVLILADKRLVTKRYGKTFLKSLQSKTVRVCTIDEIVASLRLMGMW